VDQHPQSAHYREWLAVAQNNLAWVLKSMRRTVEASDAHKESLREYARYLSEKSRSPATLAESGDLGSSPSSVLDAMQPDSESDSDFDLNVLEDSDSGSDFKLKALEESDESEATPLFGPGESTISPSNTNFFVFQGLNFGSNLGQARSDFELDGYDTGSDAFDFDEEDVDQTPAVALGPDVDAIADQEEEAIVVSGDDEIGSGLDIVSEEIQPPRAPTKTRSTKPRWRSWLPW
jgi:hypothetical protein